MAQNPLDREMRLAQKIDSIVAAGEFNGVVLVTREETVIYRGVFGYSDLEAKTPIIVDNQFVIGSISKQITAALVLREFEKGTIDLDAKLKKYLPELEQEWSSIVTVHQLLTHTHGIVNLNEDLEFEAGSQFHYSQLGFELLAKILESVRGVSFEKLSMDLFAELQLTSTFHPDTKQYDRLVKGYEEDVNGQLNYVTTSLANYAAAGAFISTMDDLNAWNYLLHAGKIVQPTTLERMKTRYATRIHPIFGTVEYGYGLLFRANEENVQIGALGYADGFVSAAYYFPAAKMSVVVLSNVAGDLDEFKKTFVVHLGILEATKQHADQE
ncbi:MAG: hypothetical protein A3D92_10390 [Bacteroidetes bacterium RIFCSPHIGHO2_02_FULL_44_7]|nr:MAG: hypothetical protein A3D92_10390 [Bacteroidetes bacterium RIFCSPHIGHO2_02_FULL_44_7]